MVETPGEEQRVKLEEMIAQLFAQKLALECKTLKAFRSTEIEEAASASFCFRGCI